ncbi:NADH(P)-binding [Novymonas esmeraldas]|uniref:NADH(P)-binding n=1 Tax=Novymonas esmeraldas TaxID=1808958 RepID=A0AAW0EZ48_9TRYP
MTYVRPPHTSYDWNAGVRTRVQRSCQAPFFSVFREENTRQAAAVYEGRMNSTDAAAAAAACPAVLDDGRQLVYFPGRNAALLRPTAATATAETPPETVTLVGATGTVGKFVAEQYLRRGISVTVLVRDMEKARALFVPIADGERERSRSAAMGYVQLGAAAERPTLAAYSDYRDAQREGRQVLRYEFHTTGGANGAGAGKLTAGGGQRVVLELVEGDVGSSQDLEFSMRHSSAVFYLAAALEEASGPALRADGRPASATVWWNPGSWLGSSRRFGGFLHAFDACRRVDAHFVALTPLWVHGSRLSPLYWYRRLVTHPLGYCKAVELQEQTLLSQRGRPGARCCFGMDELEEQQPGGDWSYWWRIWFSTELPDDFPIKSRSPVRFSLFRLSDIVYPSFNERMVAAKNNRVDDGLHIKPVQQGDLDARLLANVLVKAIGLCNSVVESRVDIGGRLRDGTDMRDAGAVFDLFEQFRNE